ncbi:hypothetical protein D3C81_2021640 [compost metagenome]
MKRLNPVRAAAGAFGHTIRPLHIRLKQSPKEVQLAFAGFLIPVGYLGNRAIKFV